MKMTTPRKFISFAMINWIMVCECIYLFTPGKNEPFEPFMVSMYLSALVVIIIQYPFLQKARTWKLKLLIFYISMVVFLFAFGVGVSWDESVGSNKAGTWDARFDGAIRMVFLGHIAGGWLFPGVVFVNWLLRNRFFDNQLADESNS